MACVVTCIPYETTQKTYSLYTVYIILHSKLLIFNFLHFRNFQNASGGSDPRPPWASPLDPAGGLPSLRTIFGVSLSKAPRMYACCLQYTGIVLLELDFYIYEKSAM